MNDLKNNKMRFYPMYFNEKLFKYQANLKIYILYCTKWASQKGLTLFLIFRSMKDYEKPKEEEDDMFHTPFEFLPKITN